MCAMIMNQEDRELTLAEVAERLQISYQTAYRRVAREKKIRARREGLEWRVKESDLADYIHRTYQEGTERE